VAPELPIWAATRYPTRYGFIAEPGNFVSGSTCSLSRGFVNMRSSLTFRRSGVRALPFFFSLAKNALRKKLVFCLNRLSSRAVYGLPGKPVLFLASCCSSVHGLERCLSLLFFLGGRFMRNGISTKSASCAELRLGFLASRCCFRHFAIV
jgi:hypothetical protein